MHRSSRSTSTTLILALAGGLVAWSGGSTGTAPCPTPADIETTIGFPVKAHSMPSDICMYELTGRYRGAFVTLNYQPATRADDLFADIRKRVKGAKGVNAQPDRVGLGEGGWGYTSIGKKEAATVSQGQLYHVEMELRPLREPELSGGCRSPGDRARDANRAGGQERRVFSTPASSPRTPRSARSPRRSPRSPSSGRLPRRRSEAPTATTTVARSGSTRARRPPLPSTRR